jgi:hypothetical protein
MSGAKQWLSLALGSKAASRYLLSRTEFHMMHTYEEHEHAQIPASIRR